MAQVLALVPADERPKYAAYDSWARDAAMLGLPAPLYGSDSDDNDWGW